MKGIGPVITTSIRNNLRSRNLIILFVGLAVMIVVALTLIFSLCEIGPELDKASPDKSHLELYLGLIMYLACFFGVGVSVAVFAVNPLIREKYRGSIESLLATPLKPKSIWLGKSLAAFLPGLVMGEAFAAIALVAINYIYILPQSGFQISLPLAISSFLLAPIMVFGFSLLVTLVGLTGSPTTANAIVIAYMVIIGVATGVIGPNNIPGTSSWLFTLVNLGIAAMIGIVIAFLYPRLTKEGIVLSRRR